MSEPTFLYELGDKVRDRVTGLIGILISRSEHLFGCARYWLQPQEAKDGKPLEGCWLDEDSIELVDSQVIKRNLYRRVVPAPDESAAPLGPAAGGPTDQPASHRHTEPRR